MSRVLNCLLCGPVQLLRATSEECGDANESLEGSTTGGLLRGDSGMVISAVGVCLVWLQRG